MLRNWDDLFEGVKGDRELPGTSLADVGRVVVRMKTNRKNDEG
jgi:hypothetical protein